MARRPSTGQRRRGPERLYPWIGTLAIIGLLFAVYVSYTANDGVPGEQYREFSVDVPDANRIVRSNQVRMAGVRVGQISTITPVPATGDHPAYARLGVKVEPDAPRVPADSTAKVRPASILGATYLDIVPGRAAATIASGGNLPLEQTSDNTELTDLLDVFDAPTRRNLQQFVTAFAGGLAGRGIALGDTIREANRMLPALSAISRTLEASDARLGSLLSAYQRAIGAFAAAEPELGTLVSDGARTFAALSRSRASLARTVDAFPRTARATTAALGALRPALDDLAEISTDLRPAATVLPGALRQTNALFGDTIPWLRVTPALARRLTTTAGSLRRFTELPQTEGSLRRLGDVLDAAGVFLERVTPAQTACNYITLFGQGWHNVFGTIGDGAGPPVGNVVLSQLGTSPLELLQNPTALPNLHQNYTPHANAQECESGNETFVDGRQLLTNPPGLQSTPTFRTTIDPAVRKRAQDAGLYDEPPAGSSR
ncbi:MlaD family protein [Patulibacter brassicae]|uniref:MlaD family protein n=1 Tax=Patulibacter brassicae TaxID=1705717 RepID=A0ABU4VN84_9ACTN|nr:MlaD family protein [Patulibacter brassicae]MDX8153325.1 MlaD family protein [Patulibacter brassicae]